MTLKLLRHRCIGEINWRDESPSKTSVDGILNSIVVLLRSLMNFVNVVQNLFEKHYCYVRELILPDRDVTYPEIEVSSSISGTSTLSYLQEHLADKEICSRWISPNLAIA